MTELTSPWKPIDTAPKSFKEQHGTQKIDILAKTWVHDTDTFAFKRFTDCCWDWDENTWTNIPKNWRAVAWMSVPELPKSYP